MADLGAPNRRFSSRSRCRMGRRALPPPIWRSWAIRCLLPVWLLLGGLGASLPAMAADTVGENCVGGPEIVLAPNGDRQSIGANIDPPDMVVRNLCVVKPGSYKFRHINIVKGGTL